MQGNQDKKKVQKIIYNFLLNILKIKQIIIAF